MKPTENNFAYIDGANLHKGIGGLGWKLDYEKFRVWLREKYGVQRAYLFIGMISKYKELYRYLQDVGYTLIFKEVIFDGEGQPKGNCDADLVLNCVRDTYEKRFGQAVIVSSDGDYSSLVIFLQEKNKLGVILSPHTKDKCSILLKRTNARISYLGDQKEMLILRQKEKAPDADGTA